MSYSILKKGLDLFKDDLMDEKDSTKKKKKQKAPEDLISTNKVGKKKELKRLRLSQQKPKPVVKVKARSTVEDMQRRKTIDHTHANLSYFQTMKSHGKTHSDTTKLILNHQRGKLSKNQPATEKKEVQESVITDRDFDEFFKNYTGGSLT